MLLGFGDWVPQTVSCTITSADDGRTPFAPHRGPFALTARQCLGRVPVKGGQCNDACVRPWEVNKIRIDLPYTECPLAASSVCQGAVSPFRKNT
jgi:hypothetical protein